jgi:hypothetical protein
MRTAEMVLRLGIKRTVLTVLVMFPLSGMLLVLTVIQQMVVLVKLPLYRRQILRSPYRAVCASRYSRQRSRNFLNSRYSFPEYEAGWSPESHTVAASKNRRSLVFVIPLL